ncbi:MAG: hypothetical protein M1838_005941, partial [Thelocarpon superellum]
MSASPLPQIEVTDAPDKDAALPASVSGSGLSTSSPTALAVSATSSEKDVSAVTPSTKAPSASPAPLPSPREVSASPGRPMTTRTPASNGAPAEAIMSQERRLSQSPLQAPAQSQAPTTIDPLSQHILQRTHAEGNIPPKLRASTLEGASKDGLSPTGGLDAVTESPAPDGAVSEAGVGAKEKKKGVSFFSRIIGTKKKTLPEFNRDDESELGDARTEGVNANVFSQPIQSSYGYTPRHPTPPEYIKVRAHNKKEREFNRVFLAQELHGRGSVRTHSLSDDATASRSPGSSGAVWALEFSKDGRYIAAGGQDRVVRIWAVISTPAEREAHEHEEDATSSSHGQHGVRLSAPVFKSKTVQAYHGHTADVLDLSWSKNNFLLSSSMDKTVRLWHVSREECLCCFTHPDFVTSIAFHPRDDRFFLAGSLDSKLRLWSIPDKNVAFWNQLPDLITAVAFAPDGKTAIAGCLNGLCLFYETAGLKYHTQIHVRSTHGRKTKGSKVTGIQTVLYPPDDPNGEVKLLITSNDSRIRLYNFRDKSLEMKFKGNENTCSQIRASFSDDVRYVICGSEDRKVYLWGTGPVEGEKKDKRPVETFAAHSAIVTTAILAPSKARQLLGGSGDPLYDLCNPPPVTLADRAESFVSSRAPTENGKRESDPSVPPTPATTETHARSHSHFKGDDSPSPAYLARSAHREGNIIVTADYMGKIKVFRQDCAYQKRRTDSWETSSTFSKKLSSGILARNGTRNSSKSGRRNSASMHPPADRILSWRNSISNTSLDGLAKPGTSTRSVSPRKTVGLSSAASTSSKAPVVRSDAVPPSILTSSPPPSLRRDSRETNTPSPTHAPGIEINPPQASPSDPLMIQEGGHSMMFWNLQSWNTQKTASPPDSAHLHVTAPISRSPSHLSRLSSETSSTGKLSSDDISDADHVRCTNCGSTSFKASKGKGGVLGLGTTKGQKLV